MRIVYFFHTVSKMNTATADAIIIDTQNEKEDTTITDNESTEIEETTEQENKNETEKIIINILKRKKIMWE